MILNKSTGEYLIKESKWLNNFFTQGWGAMFKKRLDCGLIFPFSKPTKNAASIHMFFVFTPLTVLWVNEEKVVVDKVVAKPFRVYSPDQEAKYVVELPPEISNKVKIGDYLEF